MFRSLGDASEYIEHRTAQKPRRVIYFNRCGGRNGYYENLKYQLFFFFAYCMQSYIAEHLFSHSLTLESYIDLSFDK